MSGDDQASRIASLLKYNILDTPRETGFDDIVRLASQVCETPVALVSFVSFDRQWFKASIGFDACETPLDQSVCANVVRERQLLVFPDLTQDPRTRDNPLVTGEPYIRFYAGAPLITPANEILGALCVIDSQPRPAGLNNQQRETLLALSRQVMTQLEVRLLLEESNRRAEAYLEQNEVLGATAVASIADRDRMWRLSKDIMLVATLDGVIQSINPAWSTLLGWSEADVVGKSLMDFVHPDDEKTTLTEVKRLRDGETIFRFRHRYRRADDSYCVISWAAVPEDGFISAVGRDVTGDREAETARLELEDRLRQAQKMEAVGQLTGGLAHDFNNLLTGINGSLELVQARIAQGRMSDVDRYISAAQGASRRAASLTQRLLAFSRRQTLDPKPTNVNRLVTGMEELIRRTVGPNIEIEVVGASGLWVTSLDSGQLESALLNLCINGRDAMMPNGGRLTIETANKWFDERTALQQDLPPGQYVSLCVTDTGVGMTDEVIARAFDPFFTTKPIGEGTGLGLSMIYGFARQSGGQVRIYSEIGKGTTMCLYFPRHHGEADEAEVFTSHSANASPASGDTVLVIDDEPTVRMLVAEVLEELGCGCIEAADSSTGLKALQSTAKIDLLITDVGLPGGMNGRQIADAGRALRPDLKVLFITGYAENAVVGNGQLQPGMGILTKPFVLDDLARRIRQLLRSSSTPNPEG